MADASKSGKSVKATSASAQTLSKAVGLAAGPQPATEPAAQLASAPAIPAQPPSAKPKRRSRKGVIAGVVAAVIVVVGCGMWVWHEQPGFCNAFCHTPMDPYVETYYAQADGAATDKWGNAVTQVDAMMAAPHAQAGVTCLDCHIPSLEQQVGEVREEITGGYDYPLQEQTVKALLQDSGRTGNSDTMCLASGCHDVTRADLTELTADMPRNPHSWQHGEIECDTCHKSHRASVLQCTQCHEDAESELPSGWVDWTEAQRIRITADGTAR